MSLADALRRRGRAGSMLARRKPAAAEASPSAVPPPVAAFEETPRLRDWIGIFAMGVGQFLAIMDVQIVTSSLTQIQGGLSASADEIAWVQTAYLIAAVVVVPMSGMLSRILSTRVLYLIAMLGFTGASVLCATASSLGEMILYRALQGACGGAITPMVWPVVYMRFRGRHLATVIAIISVILSLAGTLGPTLGGFLTDTFSWHWLFLVNIVPGLAVAAVVWLTIDIDKPDLSLLRHFDLIGMLLMAVFLGCLEYALHEGPRWDWLDDTTIRGAVAVSVVSGGLFFWRVLSFHQPIVDIRTFGNRNFAFGTVFTFIAGIGMYGTTYLVPLFLAQVRGYSALQIGLTIVVVGMVTMAMSPASTRIARLLDLRVMLAIGFGLFALSMYLNATLTNQTGFWDLFVPQVVRGLGLICIYMPANMIALGTLPQDRMRNAAGLYNLTRDLGGAIGLATIVTTMNDRLHFHWNRLIEDVNPARPVVQHFLDLQASRLEPLIPGDPDAASLRMLAKLVQREALVLTYNDLLLLIGAVFVFGLMLLPLVRPTRSFFSR
jgi:DHA2 family multidrug resistance protein